MIIEKENCEIDVIEHEKLNSATGLLKKIRLRIKGTKVNFYVTNAGIMREIYKDYFCPKKFYQVQAEKYINNLPEFINIENGKNASKNTIN